LSRRSCNRAWTASGNRKHATSTGISIVCTGHDSAQPICSEAAVTDSDPAVIAAGGSRVTIPFTEASGARQMSRSMSCAP
jgi:hypothetical protein